MQFLKNPAVLVIIIVICIAVSMFFMFGGGGRPGKIKEVSTYDEYTKDLYDDENAEERLDLFIGLTQSGAAFKARAAVANIGKMGAMAERAIPTLEELKDHPDERVRTLAAKAIEDINAAIAAKKNGDAAK